jgi:hypothetical protein
LFCFLFFLFCFCFCFSFSFLLHLEHITSPACTPYTHTTHTHTHHTQAMLKPLGRHNNNLKPIPERKSLIRSPTGLNEPPAIPVQYCKNALLCVLFFAVCVLVFLIYFGAFATSLQEVYPPSHPPFHYTPGHLPSPPSGSCCETWRIHSSTVQLCIEVRTRGEKGLSVCLSACLSV